jgi:hypothetical protein
MYTTKTRAAYDRLYYNEKDYLLSDRFYPGEFGMVALLGIASLLVWSLAIWGITNEPRDNSAYNSTYSMSDTEVR